MTKQRTNNKMAFVKFVLNGCENEIMPLCSEPHGTKWAGFDRVEVVKVRLSKSRDERNQTTTYHQWWLVEWWAADTDEEMKLRRLTQNQRFHTNDQILAPSPPDSSITDRYCCPRVLVLRRVDNIFCGLGLGKKVLFTSLSETCLVLSALDKQKLYCHRGSVI